MKFCFDFDFFDDTPCTDHVCYVLTRFCVEGLYMRPTRVHTVEIADMLQEMKSHVRSCIFSLYEPFNVQRGVRPRHGSEEVFSWPAAFSALRLSITRSNDIQVLDPFLPSICVDSNFSGV